MVSFYPDHYRYTDKHEWVLVEGESATIGITFHAQSEMGDIVYVDLPRVGEKLAQGASFGSVESVEVVSDIHAPVSGEVVAINEELASVPERLNQDPLGAGWLIRMKLTSPKEVADLLTADAYRKLLETSAD